MTHAVKKSARHSAFELYLRTGLRMSIAPMEVRYNHYHDPRNGRFTFSPGGGSGGGGGASGSWSNSKAKLPRKIPQVRAGGGSGGGAGATSHTDWATISRPLANTMLPKARIADQTRPLAHKPARRPQPNSKISRNGYTYELDRDHRTTSISGALKIEKGKRSKSVQTLAGTPDRLADDHGGHYIGVQFGGPRDAFNHFAQNRNFNRSAYQAMEAEWAASLRAGKQVVVRITPHYVGHSKRPDAVSVIYFVDGFRMRRSFVNRYGGR